MKVHYALAFALAASIPQLACAAGNGPASPADTAAKVSPPAASGTTSLACYFQKGTDIKYEWGLTSNSEWYQLPGQYQTTTYTKLQKFFSTASTNDITTACNNAQVYYKLVGYTMFAAFAASSGAGSNYPIVINNTELYPQY
ncbi:hypothetical protein [Tahibacter amnicola]|uniref:Secreted protein n=1 Tax=Tahibacter amnicola TaxID=2976241 RepID=A0ABY6BFZ0_9GAMM|nr:hypothetical protein [Tahibacter amnicola]UXI67526.1 hypothetical protein N4264_22755 [Tahibacter amnicola]